MARFWKEPYSTEQALALGIRDFEHAPCIGVSIERGSRPLWIYYVEVCRFKFAFYSLEMIREYLDFYSRKILPTSRFQGPFSQGAAASIGDGQSRFERLPMRLRRESKRVQVIKALERALAEFAEE